MFNNLWDLEYREQKAKSTRLKKLEWFRNEILSRKRKSEMLSPTSTTVLQSQAITKNVLQENPSFVIPPAIIEAIIQFVLPNLLKCLMPSNPSEVSNYVTAHKTGTTQDGKPVYDKGILFATSFQIKRGSKVLNRRKATAQDGTLIPVLTPTQSDLIAPHVLDAGALSSVSDVTNVMADYHFQE